MVGDALTPPPFHPRWPWVGGDLQTLRDAIRRPSWPLPPAEELSVELGDGDRVRMLVHPGGAPTVLLVHGLTGCADSIYVRAATHGHLIAGRAVARVDLRGAGPSRATCRGWYHAGRTDDLRRLVAALPPGLRAGGVVVQGFSLGANMALKLAGEGVGDLPVVAVVGVSAPLDLAATSRRFLAWRNRPYHAWLLGRMKAEAVAGAAAVDAADRALVARLRDTRDFDDRFTAPRHGYCDAADYYARCSAGPGLLDARLPVLMIHADDDPWIPVAPYLALAPRLPANVRMVIAQGGGHVGFHGRGDRLPWSERVVAAFLARL